MLLTGVAIIGATSDKTPIPNMPLNLKVGLWQMTYTTERNGVAMVRAIAPELLAKMSPEQRARTEARLRSRATQGAQVETRQYCMTEDWLKNAVFDRADIGPVCPRKLIVSTGKVQQFREECADANSKRTVDGQFEALDVDTCQRSSRNIFF
jgi:hypothetical protein